ncbi:MAG: hypothetical protein ABR974_08675 [Bacteroidales bacterium]|jgi:hypothetical protein
MKLREALMNTRIIRYSTGSPEVLETVSSLFMEHFPEIMELRGNLNGDETGGVLQLAVTDDKAPLGIFFRIQENGSGALFVRNTCHIYSFVCDLFENRLNDPVERYAEGKHIEPAFDWNRVSYDFFLTQEGRIQKDLDRASYVAGLARLGFTHVEVNGLASPMGLETGPKGEIYPMFYTYCPALDQFAYSELNKGLYPYYWLSANMNYLVENARLAVRYGLIPGLLCFEPRSVPEQFFEKYPMLRGARVDHPFRSFRPRYNMTITHPKVLDHYSEMLTKILLAVPGLGYMCVWSNDSGSGFEHTKSLYVGRNGGAYLIREWKSDEEISRLAGENVIRFLNTLKDAGRKINPSFRVLTRMESFYGEHETVWKGLGNGLDVETYSLITRGWALPYSHPVYGDNRDINGGGVHQTEFWSEEMEEVKDLEQRGGKVNFYFAHGPHQMFEPLMGIPYPFLTWEKLARMYSAGVTNLAQMGGTFPSEKVPYNINHEVVRAFMFNPSSDGESEILRIAERWAGTECAAKVIEAWKLTEQAILGFPNISSLYSSIGFTWYRLWVRPLVPDIESLLPEEREYYENFMCTTPHNPNNVDLARDVLFTLISDEKAAKDVLRIDENVWKHLDEAIEILEETDCEESLDLIHDQLIRIKALRCWIMTNRNVAAWVSAVHGYLASGNELKREASRDSLRALMELEIENSVNLLDLFDDDVEFMAQTDRGETPLIHGINMRENLRKKIKLMQEHMDDEPYIDPGYIERKAGSGIV